MFIFNSDLAVKYGVDEAIILQNFIFWIKKNIANNVNYQDGKYWTYCSVQAMTKLFPFWSEGQIVRILKSLINQGILEKGCFNENKYNRTSWYAITDNSIIDFQEMDLLKSTNGCVNSDKSFKDNNINNNTDSCLKEEKENNKKEKENLDDSFAKFWLAYMPVKCDGRFVNKGSKKEAYKRYIKAVRAGAKPEDILTGLKKYLEYCLRNNQLTCKVSVFLNQERWQDDFDTKTITSAKSVKLGCNDEGIPY